VKRLSKNLKQNDITINEIIERCKDGQDLDAWNYFLEKYSQKIYYFPLYVYNRDEEFCSNFYIYVIEHLHHGKRFKTFDFKIACCDTWFNAVLVNFYNEYLRYIKNKEIIIIESLDDYIDNNKTMMKIDAIKDERYFNAGQEGEDPIILEIRKVINEMEPKLRIVLKLQFIFYFTYPYEIELKDINLIAKEAKLSIKDILKRIEEVRKELTNKYRRYKAEEEKLERYYTKNIFLNRKLINVENRLRQLKEMKVIYPADIQLKEALIKQQVKLVNQLERNQKIIQKILKKQADGKFIVLAGKERIAYILNINPTTAGTRLHRAVKRLKERLEKFI